MHAQQMPLREQLWPVALEQDNVRPSAEARSPCGGAYSAGRVCVAAGLAKWWQSRRRRLSVSATESRSRKLALR